MSFSLYKDSYQNLNSLFDNILSKFPSTTTTTSEYEQSSIIAQIKNNPLSSFSWIITVTFLIVLLTSLISLYLYRLYLHPTTQDQQNQPPLEIKDYFNDFYQDLAEDVVSFNYTEFLRLKNEQHNDQRKEIHKKEERSWYVYGYWFSDNGATTTASTNMTPQSIQQSMTSLLTDNTLITKISQIVFPFRDPQHNQTLSNAYISFILPLMGVPGLIASSLPWAVRYVWDGDYRMVYNGIDWVKGMVS